MAEYAYSAQHIEDLLVVIKLRNMSVPDGFSETSVEELQTIYNGVGPEDWSASFRSTITKLLSFLESPALIHDWEYTCQPRTYWCFTKANLRLMWNSWKDGRFKVGVAAALLCQIGGWGGYRKSEVYTPIALQTTTQED